jgi:hypothetical protein
MATAALGGWRGLLAWLRGAPARPGFAELLERALEEGDVVVLRIGAVERSLETGAPRRGRGN